jgi:hypothetical protein
LGGVVGGGVCAGSGWAGCSVGRGAGAAGDLESPRAIVLGADVPGPGTAGVGSPLTGGAANCSATFTPLNGCWARLALEVQTRAAPAASFQRHVRKSIFIWHSFAEPRPCSLREQQPRLLSVTWEAQLACILPVAAKMRVLQG